MEPARSALPGVGATANMEAMNAGAVAGFGAFVYYRVLAEDRMEQGLQSAFAAQKERLLQALPGLQVLLVRGMEAPVLRDGLLQRTWMEQYWWPESAFDERRSRLSALIEAGACDSGLTTLCQGERHVEWFEIKACA